MATGCRVYSGGNIITTSSWQAAAVPSELYDYGGCHSTVSNTDRITPPTKGVYVFSGYAKFPSNSTGHRGIRIVTNNGTVLVQVQIPANGSSLATPLEVSTVMEFDPAGGFNQYAKLELYQSSGGNLTTDTTEFAAHLIEAT